MLSGKRQRRRRVKNNNRSNQQKRQLCTCSTLFDTFLCPCFARLQHETSRNFLVTYTFYGENVICVLVHFFFTAAYFHLALVATGIGRFQKISILYHGQLLGFLKGRGGSRLWNSEGMRGIYDWKSEGMGEFHRWDFWSRKCRVSSLKTLLLWTFVVRK